MKITFLVVGKTSEPWAIQAIQEYEHRLKHYFSFQTVVIQTPKSASKFTPDQLKQYEAEQILSFLKPGEKMVLLDEKGSMHTSEDFAQYVQKKLNAGIRNLIFVVGGPFGFAPSVYEACDERISLSKMTLTHQMVRVLFIEQLYRAGTILRNESYHHS